VVAVLLAPLRVAARRLEMAARIGTDPYVGPCGWNGEPADALQLALVRKRSPIGRDIAEAATRALPPNAWAIVACVTKSGILRGIDHVRRGNAHDVASGNRRAVADCAAVAMEWRDRVYRVVRAIPPGRVATYGLVAMVAGRPGAARAVGNVMLECEDRSVPCHRVVHADGTMGFAGQRERLRAEDVRLTGRRAATARVDLRTRLWTPRLPRERAGFSSSSEAVSRSSLRTRKPSPAL